MRTGVALSGGKVTFGSNITVPLADFSKLLQAYLTENPTTPSVEKLGEELIRSDFPHQETVEFVKEVCYWGGYPGISGRVLKYNTNDQVSSALRDAALRLKEGSIFKAICRVNELSGLGTPSFASKHLRFLCPKICGVFDSILRDSLAIPFNPSGYHEFCRDCLWLSAILTTNKIPCSASRKDGIWFAADAEGAVYMFARSLRPHCRPC